MTFQFSSSDNLTLNLSCDTMRSSRNHIHIPSENKPIGSNKYLYLNNFTSSPQSTIDNNSPKPTISFSPRDQPMTLSKQKLHSCLVELVQSEYLYLASLKQLRDAFFDNCVETTESSYSLKIIKYCILHLIEIHSLLVNELTKLYPGEKSIYEVAELFSEKVCEFAICKFWYEEYINQYEDFLTIAKSNNFSNNKSISICWATAWQKYLEKAQSSRKHLDYSIESLSQGPTSRIAKYKLLVQSIHKHCQENIETSTRINNCLNQIHLQLVQLNDYSWKLHDQQCKFNQQLEGLINFGTPFVHDLTIEFFGNPLLIGSTTIIWIENNDSRKVATYPTILFKSHLIICDNIKSRRFNTHNIKFIIPLSKTKLITDFKNCGGIFTKYPYSIKLLFEIGQCQYEVVFVFLTELEFTIWRDWLDALINHVNGPCNLKFEKDDIQYVCVYPPEISYYDVDLEGEDFEKNWKKCYFKHSINLGIHLDFPLTELPSQSNQQSQYFNNDHLCSLLVKKANVVANQTSFEKYWSKELPIYFKDTPSVQTKRSWSLKSSSSIKRKHSTRTGSYKKEQNTVENIPGSEQSTKGIEKSHDDFPQPITSRSNSLQKFKAAVTLWMYPPKSNQNNITDS